jgi:pyridoxal phosphate enzyme (YggS family)
MWKSALADNLDRVRERVAEAAIGSGRDPAEITIVAVSKTQPVEVIQAAYDLGLRHFGENRIEEASEKFDRLPADIQWHMVGHVQSRKAVRAVSPYVLVHSVDSVKLARRLNTFAHEAGRVLPVLLEISLAGEMSKHGFSPSEAATAADTILSLQHLALRGLMTMAPIVPDPQEARPMFSGLREIRDQLASQFPDASWGCLSMGMTDDFAVAIEEGSTMVRIGRAIFGERH